MSPRDGDGAVPVPCSVAPVTQMFDRVATDGNASHRLLRELTQVCRGCPINVWCLKDALRDVHSVGFRAGTTEAQRVRLRARGRRTLRRAS